MFDQEKYNERPNILSYGAGTQSTALLLMSLENEFGLPRPDYAIFADTGGEPEHIYDYLEYINKYVQKRYNFEILIIREKANLVDVMTEPEKHNNLHPEYTWKRSTPPFFSVDKDKNESGSLRRYCTSDFKSHPIEKTVTNLIGRGKSYNMWIAISFDERSRMKESNVKKINRCYPLVENYVNRQQSIEYVELMGVKKPSRSACYFCPYHSDKYWKNLKENNPSEFAKAVKFERQIQNVQKKHYPGNRSVYLHRSGINLDEIQFNENDQLSLFPELIDECDGYCGT